MVKMQTSISGVIVTRALGILFIVCLAECAAASVRGPATLPEAQPRRSHLTRRESPRSNQHIGSCLSYGHSCWGAHGKRSLGHEPGRKLGSLPLADRWFISRLLRPELRRNNEPLFPLNINRVPIDEANIDNWQRSGEERKIYNLDKNILPSELSEEDRNAIEEIFSDDSVPRPDKINFLQILKANNAGMQ